MQHVAGDVAERGPEHGTQGHAGYLSDRRAESRSICARDAHYFEAPRAVRRGARSLPADGMFRDDAFAVFAPSQVCSSTRSQFRSRPSRSDARRNRARA